MNKNTQTIIRSMRIPFLILTPSVVFLGICTSIQQAGSVSVVDLLLVMLGAISAHMSVNLFNEYHDFHSGLDAITNKTPFSGGSGALIDCPDSEAAVRSAAILTLSITIFIGIYFIYAIGLSLLWLGLLGVVIIVTYTKWLNRHPLLCLIAPGLGFGPLIVVGTYFVLTSEWSWSALFISLVPFFLANNLLLLNQFPDISADKTVGRRHVPIVFGIKKSIVVYAVFSIAALAVLLQVLMSNRVSIIGYVVLVPVLIQLFSVVAISQYAKVEGKLLPYMGINVIAAVSTPVLLGLSIINS